MYPHTNRIRSRKVKSRKEGEEEEEKGSSTIVGFLNRSQILLAILLGICIAVIPEIREQVGHKPLQYIIVTMSFELVMFAFVSYIFGMSRIPTNYISLIFLRFFVFFDCQYWDRVDSRKRVAGGSNQPHDKWLVNFWNKAFGYRKQIAVAANCCTGNNPQWNAHAEKLIYGFLILSLITIVAVCSKIDISRCECAALSLMSVGSFMSTIILISSMALDRLGRECHWKLCTAWTLISLAAALFTFVFATQRLYKKVNGKVSGSPRFYRTQAELVIFAINLSVVVYFIPMIHPTFSFYNTVSEFPTQVGQMIPHPVYHFADSVFKETLIATSKFASWWPLSIL